MKTYENTVGGRRMASARTFESINPATGEPLGRVPHCTPQEVREAVAAAHAAQPAWAARPDAERQALLKQVAATIQANAEYLAGWVTREQGKPLGGVGPGQVPGARFEIFGCQAWTEVLASLALPVELVFEDETRRDELHRQPFGVIAAIAPWNWPLLIAVWQVIPALRTGNTVVLKPSETASIGTLELVRLMAEVLPPGVINTVSGPGDVGAVLVEQPEVAKTSMAPSIRWCPSAAARVRAGASSSASKV